MYFSLNPFLDNSMDCSIGFQLNQGLSDCGILFIEKKIPEVKNKGL